MAFLPPSARARQLAAQARADREQNRLYEQKQEEAKAAEVVEPTTVEVVEPPADVIAPVEVVEPPAVEVVVEDPATPEEDSVTFTKTALGKLTKSKLLDLVNSRSLDLPPEANTKAEIIDCLILDAETSDAE